MAALTVGAKRSESAPGEVASGALQPAIPVTTKVPPSASARAGAWSRYIFNPPKE
jgi:hypothetical protein